MKILFVALALISCAAPPFRATLESSQRTDRYLYRHIFRDSTGGRWLYFTPQPQRWTVGHLFTVYPARLVKQQP